MSASAAVLPEVLLSEGSLVIGDLHLDVASQPAPEPFLHWLAGLTGVPRLVILGDLFDAWVGPAHTRVPAAAAVLEALWDLGRRGTAVDVLHGNRDFLLDARFERESGARVHPAGLVGRAGAERVLLIHGDELCTRDRAYQRLRRVLRSGPVRGLARRLPAAATLPLARRLRRTSIAAVDRKPSEVLAQDPDAALAEARARGCDTVVCGHAHRFRDERLPCGPRWIVVDAFGGPRDTVRVGTEGRLEVIGAGDVPARGPEAVLGAGPPSGLRD